VRRRRWRRFSSRLLNGYVRRSVARPAARGTKDLARIGLFPPGAKPHSALLSARARTEPERTAAPSDDELAARLTRLAPLLDEEARSSLLFALFPVPDAVGERPEAAVLVQAIASARRDGVLAERAGAFLQDHPDIAERLRRPVGKPFGRGLFEAGLWVAAAVAVAMVAFALFAKQNPAMLHWRSRVALAPVVTPVAPPLDVRATRPTHRGVRLPQATQAPAGSPPSAHSDPRARPKASAKKVQAGTAVPRAPHTPHPLSFTSYFQAARRFWSESALATPEPPSRPTATPSPEPTPRVHSLFGRWFGPRGAGP
jgi:hypothetical protein